MVRTKADGGGRKAVAAKAPRKVLGSNTSGGGGAGGSMMSPKVSKYAGGNSAQDRPTPDWQKDIGTFFQSKEKENNDPTEEQEENGMETDGPSAEDKAGSGSSKEVTEASEGGSSSPSSQEVSGTETTTEPCESPVKKQKKTAKNNIIDSDSDGE